MRKPARKTVIKFIVLLMVIVFVGVMGYRSYGRFTAAVNASKAVQETVVKAERGNLEVKLTGTGTLEPFVSYDVVSTVKGDILSAPYEVGDRVAEGDLLYKLDDTEQQNTVQKAENNILRQRLSNQSTEDSIGKLTIYSPVDGIIDNISVSEGDQISSGGKIAEVADDRELSAIVPFSNSQIKRISIGQPAKLMIPQFFTYIDGVVVSISKTSGASVDGIALYDVEIRFENTGSLAEGTKVTGTITVDGNEMVSPAEGKISSIERKAVTAQIAGTVKRIFVNDNDYVKAGQIIAELENESLISTYQKNELDMRDLELSLQTQQKLLDEYSILSPIDGTVLEKNFKAGDSVNGSGTNAVLMKVADISKMKFTVSIDELDISKVSVGQKASITADALPDKVFEGVVTSIAVLGNSQNGVTSYPVEITINEPGQLKPGMNVNAEILVESKKNVLYVPMAAITKLRGKTFVTVKDTNAEEQTNHQSQGGNAQYNKSASKNTMQGRIMREVEVGINNDDYIEIISGLEEGETVVLPVTSQNTNSDNPFGFPGGNGGGMRAPRGDGAVRIQQN
ncbi:MAG: efflux RND transporter periplasmic adaptor subunit [Bacillota bacterium]